MKAKIALISLRFNPAFIQHLIAYAKATRELGYEPEFLLDPAYRDFRELDRAASHNESSTNVPALAWKYALFLNPSLGNEKLATNLKQKGTKLLYVYHEPWHMSLDYLWSEGLVGTLKAIMAHHVTIPALKLADTVIVPSQYGLRMYQKSDARYNANGIYLPLMYDDEAPSAIDGILAQKRHFGYIGSLCRSHGFDQYLSFVRYALQRDLKISFLIASRNPLPASTASDPLLSRNPDRVKIYCGKPLENDEINRFYAESICVWNLYRRSTQSGVLPKAFMFGTPVIAKNIGSFPEFIQDGLNGRFASARDHQGIYTAFDDMRSNIAAYATNSRRTFLETFYYRARLADLSRLLS
jgi:glycosyltransferase involved in cell wall biosynthesis